MLIDWKDIGVAKNDVVEVRVHSKFLNPLSLYFSPLLCLDHVLTLDVLRLGQLSKKASKLRQVLDGLEVLLNFGIQLLVEVVLPPNNLLLLCLLLDELLLEIFFGAFPLVVSLHKAHYSLLVVV